MAESSGDYQEQDPAIAAAFPYALADNDRNRMVFASGYRAGRASSDAEVEKLRTDLDSRFEQSDHQSAKYYKRMRIAERERDALKARLDAMTVEYLPGRIRQRLVGPWTVAPDGGHRG